MGTGEATASLSDEKGEQGSPLQLYSGIGASKGGAGPRGPSLPWSRREPQTRRTSQGTILKGELCWESP